MSESTMAPLYTWLAAPMDRDVSEAIDRLRRARDVQHVAVMPDVHLAADVCIGVVVATSTLLYPQAVGGDIGCGVLSVALDCEAAAIDERVAGEVLNDLRIAVPGRRRNRRKLIAQPADLGDAELSSARLESIRRNDGAIEFATLGSGNHFLELEADEGGRLWLTVHSGSRVLGQSIRDYHLSRASQDDGHLRSLDAASPAGAAYLHDVVCARRFADASRRAIAAQAVEVLARRIRASVDWATAITTDHNHLARETHDRRDLWVHRKGAMRAAPGEWGVLPGSMGALTFHV